MSKTLLAVTAVLGFASWNVIIESKLAKLPPFTLLALVSIGQVFIPLAIAWYRKDQIVPSENQAWWIVICWVILTVANTLYFLAYQRGLSAVAVTTIVILMPVFATAINFILRTGSLSIKQAASFVLAA